MTRKVDPFEVVDLGRCTFAPPIGAPQVITDPARRIVQVPKISTPPVEEGPSILVFKVTGDIAVPSDATTREVFNQIARLINQYLSMAGGRLSDAAGKLLASIGIVAIPLRIPVDGKLSNTHLVGFQAVAIDYQQKMGVEVATPSGVQAFADNARTWAQVLTDIIEGAAAGEAKVPTNTSTTTRKKRSNVAIAIGVGAAGVGLLALLRR